MCSVYAILRRHSYISNIKWYIKTKLVLWWNIIEIEVVESVLLEYKQASDVWILVIVYSGLHCCRQQSTSPHPVYCYIEGPFSKSKLKDSKSEIKKRKLPEQILKRALIKMICSVLKKECSLVLTCCIC